MRINRGAMCDNTIFLHETASKLHGIVKMSRWIILSVLSLLLAACVSCDSIADGVDQIPVISEVSQFPLDCNSPGWRERPRDATILPGRYIFMTCLSFLDHTNTYWLVNGMEDIMNSPLSAKVFLFRRNHTLRYGPADSSDPPVVIGCRAQTIEHGLLPSPLATITILSPPQYSPPPFAVAVQGRPFVLDMGYINSEPPLSYIWMKDGMLFEGEEDRVHIEHDSIIFNEVIPDDYARYDLRARNGVGEGYAFTFLKVLAWPANTTVNLTDISPHLALLLTIYQQSNTAIDDTPFLHTSIDRLGVMAVIRRLLYHASQVSLQQGTARMELEELLERIQSMIGPLGATITASDIARLNRITNCTSVIPEFDCTDYAVLKYRTYDGTCNNLFYPRFGAAEIAFPRLLPAEYENGIAAPVGQTQAMNGNHTSAPWPSARVISWKVVKNGPESETDPAVSSGITQMVMQWGQFLDHDIDLSPVFDIDCGGCNYTKKCSPIHVNMKDNTFGNDSSNEGECLSFTRSIPACLVDSTTSLARNQINQVTSFIDGSQVYGSSKELALSLRSDVSGLLKQGGRAESLKGNLPFQKERPEGGLLPFFIAGDERANEQTGLTVMHTLWLREHNRIARKLAKINQCWGDEKLYQVSRKIVGALMQKITYSDFLPVLFGPYLTTYVPLYTKYNPFVDPSIPNSFAASAYRFGHSLIRNQLLRLGENYTAMDIGHLDLSRAFFNPVSYFESCGTDGLVRGLMVDSADPVDEFLNSVLTSKLFPKIPGGLGGDLASLNIQRGRDHGIPSYRRWQQFCEQIFPGHIVSLRDNKTEETLRWLYGEEGFREGMDLWVGGLAEERLPGAQIGPTFACILGLTFTRLRDGDRFWYEADYQFSTMQIRSLQQSSLGRVVCDNSDNIQRVSKDVFRSDSVRVSCDELQAIDLLLWRDYTCSRRHSHPHSHGG